MLMGLRSSAIPALPTSSSKPPLFSNTDSTSPFPPRQLGALCVQPSFFAFFLATRHPLARRSFSGGGLLAIFLNPSRLSAATLPLSTLAQSPLPTPLQSTHPHLSHSRPPITHAKKRAAVGAPTFSPCRRKKDPQNRSEDRPLQRQREERLGSSKIPGNANLPVGDRRSAIQENGVPGWRG